MLGEMPAGYATTGLNMVDGGLDQLGGVLANLQGGEVDPDNPGLRHKFSQQCSEGFIAVCRKFVGGEGR